MKKFFILSLALLACACMDRKEDATEEQQPELSWGTAALCIENPIALGESLNYQIEIKLDTLVGDSLLAGQLAAVLRDSVLRTSGYATIQEAITAVADSMEEEWKKELAERYEPESEYKDMLQYYYTVTGKAESDGSVLTYRVTTSCFLGGAHGSYVVQYYNFDKESGKLLNIGDFIPASKEMLVLMAMEEQLCKDWNAKDLADLQEKTGITMLGDLYLTNNFFVKGDSITFLFNQYEIAPYSAGLISVTIPSPAIP